MQMYQNCVKNITWKNAKTTNVAYDVLMLINGPNSQINDKTKTKIHKQEPTAKTDKDIKNCEPHEHRKRWDDAQTVPAQQKINDDVEEDPGGTT